MIRVLRQGLERYFRQPEKYVTLVNERGEPITVERDMVEYAAEAHMLDAAAFRQKRLVYQEGTVFQIDYRNIRRWVWIAQQYDNVDIALLDIMTEVMREHGPGSEGFGA